MEDCCLSNHKSLLSILMMTLLLCMVGRIQGVCNEDERRALIKIKVSLHEYFSDVGNLLSTWVDHDSTGGGCCEWKRIKCDTVTGHVTDLLLSNVFSEDYEYLYDRTWPLNASLFLHFKELKSLDLSYNYIDSTFVGKGLENLSSLKKLEALNLSNNRIETNIFPSLGSLTLLKILDLSYLSGYVRLYSIAHDIFEFSTLENLEVLDLTGCGYYGTLQMQGYEKGSILRKLKILSLGTNQFNESLITSLSTHQTLKALDLSNNELLIGPVQFEELSKLTNLEELDLSFNNLQDTPDIQGCKSLLRMKNLESISLVDNSFNSSIISCLSFLPSLKNLNLSQSHDLGTSFPMQELFFLKELKTLDLSNSGLESLTSNGTIRNLVYLNLDINHFTDDIMWSMSAFPSLRYLSLEFSFFIEGKTVLFANGLPTLPDLEVLLLRGNGFNGILPMEDITSFHRLEVLDLSENNFFGSISSAIKSLSSVKAISFANNMLNGSLPNGFCELKNLQELDLSYNNIHGVLPECFNKLSSLKLFDISSNQFTGMLHPSLIANLRSLEYVDFSHNKFEGLFSFSLFANHTKLKIVAFINDNDKFKVETEDPLDWTPMFQLKVLVLSNCNLKGTVPSFLLHQHELETLDMSYNSLEGRFPTWLIENNTKLQVIHLGVNSFSGAFNMPLYRNAQTAWSDGFGNLMKATIIIGPQIVYLNLSRNSFDGAIPSALAMLNYVDVLDLSHNKFSGEVPNGWLTNSFTLLKLSNNRLHGEILSNCSLGMIENLFLDNNNFTGNIANETIIYEYFSLNLDISNNLFTGSIPSWVYNISTFVARNNRLGGQFPCGATSLSFLDLSQNYFSGPISSCLDFQSLEHLHLGSNQFTGSLPDSLRNLTNILTLSMNNNSLSGRIPEFLGELPNLRILLLGKNNFSGPIPKKLCQLSNVSLIDLSSNSISGPIPGCLQNITGPSHLAYEHIFIPPHVLSIEEIKHMDIQSKAYSSILYNDHNDILDIQDEIQFTAKRISWPYKGVVLYLMSGLDLSCNKLTGDIPEELGLLIQINTLNLSHNRLTGPIPAKFSNLANIESLDLSFNSLTGQVPSQLVMLKSLAVFNVSYNNLSGRLPEMKAQFGTFSKESYEGNPLLCGLPLENKCTTESYATRPLNEEERDDKWLNMDKTSFYGSCGSTWFVFMLGFAALLYINPYWRRRWLYLVEECMYTCYYFLYDLVRKLFMLFHKQE